MSVEQSMQPFERDFNEINDISTIVDSKRLVLTSGGARSRAFLYFLNQRQPLVNQPQSSHKFEGYNGAIHDEIRFKEF